MQISPHKIKGPQADGMEQKKATYQSIKDSQVLYIFANRFEPLNDISTKKMKKIDFQLQEGESYIQLIQLLKATNLVYNGAEAQSVVTEGLVRRNGEVELRKRAKIIQGDIIQFNNYEISVK